MLALSLKRRYDEHAWHFYQIRVVRTLQGRSHCNLRVMRRFTQESICARVSSQDGVPPFLGQFQSLQCTYCQPLASSTPSQNRSLGSYGIFFCLSERCPSIHWARLPGFGRAFFAYPWALLLLVKNRQENTG